MKIVSTGYIIEVDLEYPEELQVLHDYPLAPKNLQFCMKSCHIIVKKIAGKYGIKVGDVMKLIPNLGDKINYVLPYRNLQLYLSLGMKLTKIHRVLRFKKSDWMKKNLILTLKKEQMPLIVLKKKI